MRHARSWAALAASATLAALLAVTSCGGAVAEVTDAAPATTPSTVAPAPVDAAPAPADAAPADARDAREPPRDAAPSGRCVTPAECGATPAPLSVVACKESSWSCVLGQCTWECRGGRTCTRDGRGCLACDRGGVVERSCPGDTCVEGLLPRDGGWGGAESTCARAFTVEVVSCAGEDVALRGGETCTLQSLFTGAPRAVLQCGPCQTVLGP